MNLLPNLFLPLIGLSLASVAIAQESEIPSGKWVKHGTYAISGFSVVPEREKSYSGAARERSRLLTYLPAMTIVFPDFAGLIDETPILPGYIRGITHSGIPVVVLESQLSRTSFGIYETHDVVVHSSHLACSEEGCHLDVDGRPVGEGHSYKIADKTDEVIHLTNPTNETDLYYRPQRFDYLESRGVLTRTKDRTHPRWEIREGYAEDLSVGCGGEQPEGTIFTVEADAYEKPPSDWEITAPQWTVKAAELFVGSTVERSGGEYRAEITSRIHDVTKNSESGDSHKSAIDFTVFAYRDRNSPGAQFRFAVLISIVACTKPLFGEYVPTYVREAHLYFKDSPYKLPSQLTEEGRAQLFKQVGRSFFYSVNSAREYERLSGQLASELDVEHSDERATLLSAVLSRLNATCDGNRRGACDEIVDAHAVRSDSSIRSRVEEGL